MVLAVVYVNGCTGKDQPKVNYDHETRHLYSQIHGCTVTTSLLPEQWALFCVSNKDWATIPYFYKGVGRSFSTSKMYFSDQWMVADDVPMGSLVEAMGYMSTSNQPDPSLVIDSGELDSDSESDEEDDEGESVDSVKTEGGIPLMKSGQSKHLYYENVFPATYGLNTKFAFVAKYKSTGEIVSIGGGKKAYLAKRMCDRFFQCGMRYSMPQTDVAQIVTVKQQRCPGFVGPNPSARPGSFLVMPEIFHISFLARLPFGMLDISLDSDTNGIRIDSECVFGFAIVHLTSENWEKCYLASLGVQEKLIRIRPTPAQMGGFDPRRFA